MRNSNFTDFAKRFLEKYAMRNIPCIYNVSDYGDEILIRKEGSPTRKNGLVYYDIVAVL